MPFVLHLLQMLSALSSLSLVTVTGLSIHIPGSQEGRVGRRGNNNHILRPVQPPSGSVAPIIRDVVRRKSTQSTSSIRVMDLTPVPVDHAPASTPDHQQFSLSDGQGNMERQPTATSSSHSAVRARGNVKKITECRRKPKYKPLTTSGCKTVFVDVGYCQGACRSRESPGESLLLIEDNAFGFVMQRKCRTCRAEFETKRVRMACHTPLPGNGLHHYGSSITSVAIKVVKKCSCQRCST